MKKVFDASAVIAALFEEEGAHEVIDLWLADGDKLISAVNYAEVVTKLYDRGMNKSQVETVLEAVPLTIISLDQHSAFALGALRPSTKPMGLSLGDRACLALGLQQDALIITADKAWLAVSPTNIKLIR